MAVASGPAMHWRTLIAVIAAALFVAGTASAQCGASVSTCRQCHEIDKQHPVLADGRPWHVDHAFGDFCADCHGGDAKATDVAAAHAGLGVPLGDAALHCGSATCHGARAAALAASYRTRPPSAGAPPPSVARPARNGFAIAVALALAVGGALLVAWNERHRRLQGAS